MQIVNEERLENILSDISPVCKVFSEELLGKRLVLLRLSVVDVPRGQLPLDALPLVVDDQMQFESIEPAHRALPLSRPSLHGLVLLLPLDVAGYQGRGVDDGYARALAEGTGLQEQQMEADLSLALHETVV